MELFPTPELPMSKILIILSLANNERTMVGCFH